jgi:hypothetical protein
MWTAFSKCKRRQQRRQPNCPVANVELPDPFLLNDKFDAVIGSCYQMKGKRESQK